MCVRVCAWVCMYLHDVHTCMHVYVLDSLCDTSTCWILRMMSSSMNALLSVVFFATLSGPVMLQHVAVSVYWHGLLCVCLCVGQRILICRAPWTCCVAVQCSALQYITMRCSVYVCGSTCFDRLSSCATLSGPVVLQCVAVGCSMSPWMHCVCVWVHAFLCVVLFATLSGSGVLQCATVCAVCQQYVALCMCG